VLTGLRDVGRSVYRERFFRIAKWLWLLAVSIVAAGLVRRYWADISQQLRLLTLWQLVASIGCLIAGKALLGISAHHAVRLQENPLGFKSVMAMVSLSQLGKYIPGGIWHFLGRAAMYASHGMSSRGIARSLILENVWQWSGALFVGVLFLMYAWYPDLHVPVGRPFGMTVLVIVAVAVWWPFYGWMRGRLAADAITAPSPWTILALQAGAWLCFGVSLWALLPASPPVVDAIGLAIGAFAISTLAGFLVPLAPAGLGVRELVLVAALSRQFSIDQAAVCAGLSRFAWLAVELALAAGLYRFYSPHRVPVSQVTPHE